MTIRNVGPNSTYPTIAAAVAASAAVDIIRLEDRYSNERAVLTVEDLTVMGGASSRNIDLVLGAGIKDVTLAGLADIEVFDNRRSNTITGNGGDNELHVSGGTDVVLGGAGRDRLEINYSDATTSVIGTMTGVTDGGTDSVTFDSSVEDFTIVTGSGDDTITAGDGRNNIEAWTGNNTIRVGDGRNIVYTSDGDDTVTTGDGDNTVSVHSGNNMVTTGAGNDSIYTNGEEDDTLVSGAGADFVQVTGGIDTVDAGVGHDVLYVNYAGWNTNVTASLIAGNRANGYSGMVEDAGGNSVSFTGVEDFFISTGDIYDFNDYLQTGAGNDTLKGGGGNDTLRGAGGDDELNGGLGDDILVGGADQDELYGGGGDDTLIGSLGRDRLFGDDGADTFRFRDPDFDVAYSGDTIIYLDGTDTIDLSRIDADVTAAGDQAFVFVDSFSGKAGEATISTMSGIGFPTVLAFDTDGDRAADITITIVPAYPGFDNFVL